MRRLSSTLVDYKARKVELNRDNISVRRPIERLDPDVVKSKSGRPRKLTPTKLRNNINGYFAWCEENDEIPSIKGLCIHCKMYKDMFYKYLNYPEYTDMLEHARMIISNWIETDIYNTKGMAVGKINYAKNVHGWSDKIESTNQTTVRTISVDEARAKIEMLAPKLLELMKNQNVLNQLAEKPVVEGELVDA
jgi:hypothetical protein